MRGLSALSLDCPPSAMRVIHLFTCHCIRGLPDWQILLMPFKDPHPEDDQDILDIIDELIDANPYGTSKSLLLSDLHLLIPFCVQSHLPICLMILI